MVSEFNPFLPNFLLGLNLGTGEFKITCPGLHAILATLVVSSSVNTAVDLGLIVDRNTTYNTSSKHISTGSTSIHVSVVFNLKEGQTLQLRVTSSPIATLQLSRWSTLSIWNIGPLSTTMSDFSRIVMAASISVAGGKVTDSLIKSSGVTQVKTAYSSSLVNTNDNSILCAASKVYLAFVSLRLKINSLRHFTITSKVQVGSSAEVLSSSTVNSGSGQFYETMSMGFVLKCDKRKLISIEIQHNTQAAESLDILAGSSLALIESRLAYPDLVGAKSRADNVEFTAGGGSKELKSWSVSMGRDCREGKQFSESTGRFRAHEPGIYFVSANVEFSTTSVPTTSVSLSIAVNGLIQDKSPLTRYIGNPANIETLSISCLLNLEEDDHVSLIIQSPGATGQLQIETSSGFFIAHIGKTSLIPAFSSYLTKEFSTSESTTNVVSSNLTKGMSSSHSSFLSGEWVRNDIAGTFSAPVAGAYMVTCTVTLNDTAPSSNVAYYAVQIVGSNSIKRAMFDECYSSSSSTRDFFTLNAGGVLNLAKGDIIGCQLTNGKSGSIRVITAGFSAALIQYSGSGTGFNTYTADASILAKVEGYVPIILYTTTPGFPYFETDTKNLVESNGKYTADTSSVLFISGYVGIQNGADSDKTYQATLRREIEGITKYSSNTVGVGTVKRGSAPKFSLSFTGLYQVSVGTVTSLVVRANPDDNLWKIDKGTGWSLYSFPNDSPRQPGILDGRTINDQIKKGAPYFVR